MELEAVVGAVVELGERLGVPMPATRAVYACAKLLDAQHEASAAVPGRGRHEHEQPLVPAVASLIAMIMIANLQYAWTLFVDPLQKAPAGGSPTSSGRSRCSSSSRPGCSRSTAG